MSRKPFQGMGRCPIIPPISFYQFYQAGNSAWSELPVAVGRDPFLLGQSNPGAGKCPHELPDNMDEGY